MEKSGTPASKALIDYAYNNWNVWSKATPQHHSCLCVCVCVSAEWFNFSFDFESGLSLSSWPPGACPMKPQVWPLAFGEQRLGQAIHHGAHPVSAGTWPELSVSPLRGGVGRGGGGGGEGGMLGWRVEVGGGGVQERCWGLCLKAIMSIWRGLLRQRRGDGADRAGGVSRKHWRAERGSSTTGNMYIYKESWGNGCVFKKGVRAGRAVRAGHCG